MPRPYVELHNGTRTLRLDLLPNEYDELHQHVVDVLARPVPGGRPMVSGMEPPRQPPRDC